MADDDDLDDDCGNSSTCYSNSVFSVHDEQTGIAGSAAGGVAAADYGGLSRSSRGVQFDVKADDERPARPQYTAVVTKERKPTIFEKKFRGTLCRLLNLDIGISRFSTG